ncbi:MAG: L,D-transpeptidase family protein [Caulobacteraceae bacterium]|nr:L,D-transpeptidase family protein [Caulobacter sp.]
MRPSLRASGRGLLGGAALLALTAPILAAAAPAQPAASVQGPIDATPPAAADVAPAPLPPPPPVVEPAHLSRSQADELRRALASATSQGVITPSVLGADGAQAVSFDVSDSDDEAAVAQATLRYARAVHASRLQPDDYLHDWGLRPAAYDPTPSFNAAVRADRLSDWLASLPPPYDGYEGLRQGLIRYRKIRDAGGWPVISAGDTLGPGSTGARVVTLRRRLLIENGADDGSDSPTYDQDLAEKVADAQRRYGLKPTGVVDAATLAALNVPVSHRIVQIEANLERWRWLPPTLPADRIQVNIAAAILTLFRGDQPVTSMRAVTGRPGDETPMLQSTIHSIVINPPWNVPSSIATKELWPKEKAHKGYLAAHGFKVIKTDDNGGVRLQQAAGTRSALGRIKFDFSNPYGVYLHGTPVRGTFQQYSRNDSHGCVRLQAPDKLAALLLRDDPKWSDEGAVDAAIDTGVTSRATVPQPIAVYLLYWTAFAQPDGRISFRADPYGWDDILVQRLRGAPPPPAEGIVKPDQVKPAQVASAG